MSHPPHRPEMTATRMQRSIVEPPCDDRSPDLCSGFRPFVADVIEWMAITAVILLLAAIVGVDTVLIRLVVLIWLS